MYDNMADLYSIIVLMEHLEKAFIRDSITADEYTPQCANLIAKYKTTMNFLSDSVDNLETFMNEYKVRRECVYLLPPCLLKLCCFFSYHALQR